MDKKYCKVFIYVFQKHSITLSRANTLILHTKNKKTRTKTSEIHLFLAYKSLNLIFIGLSTL